MALDWISRLFSSGSAKGLSGDTDSGLLDPSAYYSGRLRRHRTTGDLVEDPFLIWQTEGKRGLRAHLTSKKNQGSADFTDVLIIVNSQDFARSMERVSEPWVDSTARVLGQELQRFQDEVGFELLFAHRGTRFRIIQDGGPDMSGEDYGLEPGEFISGLLPNTYTGAAAKSRPVIAIHLNIPDVWEGYREVGHLYSDQVVFTLGNHWLDSFNHFALQEPALYRLQQYLDGSFVHIIDPDLQHRYSVTSDDAAGANVLSIVDVDGEPVCHLVLALMDSMVPDEPSALKSGNPAPATPAAQSGGVMPQIELPPPGGLSSGNSLMGMGHKTIVPESVQERIFTLRERGALLQKVHFRKFMQGYDVYVSPTGNLSTACVDRAATFQVRNDVVALVVHKPDVLVNGRTVSIEVAHPLTDQTTLQVGPHTLEYNDLSRRRSEPGWPYLGEILRPPTSTHLVFGGKYRIGRDRRCKIQLPDEPQNDNIAWLPSTASGTTIRARSGEIPKSRFYTDSIMVASEHAEIDLTENPQLSCIARHCYAYVRRDGDVSSLYPTKQSGDRRAPLKPGDDLLIGNCLFRVSYAPEDTAEPVASRTPAPPPPPKLTAEDLAGAIDTGTTDVVAKPMAERQAPAAIGGNRSASLIDQILNAPRPGSGTSERRSSIDALLEARTERKPKADATDLPPSAGLGEKVSTPPRTYDPGPVGFDSLMDSEPPRDAFGDPSILPSPEEAQQMADPDTGDLYGLPAPQTRKQADKTPFDVFGGPVMDEPPSIPPAPPAPVAPTIPPLSAPPVTERAPPKKKDAGSTWSATDSVVAIVDDEQVQFELARPARLVQIGWALSGDAVVGNYLGCAAVVPENRFDEDQEFPPQDYMKLKVRGKRGKAELVNSDEARMEKDGDPIVSVKGLDGVRWEIIRRDEDGDEDFTVSMALDAEFSVPDPRGRLLRVDTEDPVVLGLFATGLPLGASHPVHIGPIHCNARFEAGKVMLSDYLDSYRIRDGKYQPFFIRRGADKFVTAPEDGRPVALNFGDHIISGTCVYRVDER